MVRNMSGDSFHIAFQHHVNQRTFPGPFMVTTSPILEGAPPVFPTWKVVAQPDEVEPIVQSCVKRGYQQIKVYNLIQPEVLGALGQAATALDMCIVGHCPDAMASSKAIASGHDLLRAFDGHLAGASGGRFEATA